jgi:hypothetical protein
MKPATNRLEQTLATLRLVRQVKNAPINRWQIILILANSKHHDGRPKSMTCSEISNLADASHQGTNIRLLVADGLVMPAREGAGINDYLLTDAGRREAERIIVGMPAYHPPKTNPHSTVDMSKVHAYVGTPQKGAGIANPLRPLFNA